jgi:hypothetical protein
MSMAALGLKVQTGHATAVALSGRPDSPAVALREVLILSDPAEPRSRQPYHLALDSPEEATEAEFERLLQAVRDTTGASIGRLVELAKRGGFEIAGAAVVGGSATDPVSIRGEHIRAHAMEGRLYRDLVQRYLVEAGLQCLAFGEKALPGVAAEVLKRSPGELAAVIGEMGRAVGGPWRAAEKTAALAAWVALASKRP